MTTISTATGSRPIECIVFDKDGTLIELNRLWGAMAERWVTLLTEACGLDASVGHAIYHTVGYDLHSKQVVADGPLAVTTLSKLAVVIATVIHQQGVDWHHAIATTEAILFDPANALPSPDMLLPLYQPHFFAQLAKLDVKLAILTSDDRAATEETLRLLGLDALFCAVGCADDEGIRPKPSRDGIDRIAAMCDVPASRMIMVGDSLGDMATGRNGGLAQTVGIGASPDRFGDKADIVLANVDALLAYLNP